MKKIVAVVIVVIVLFTSGCATVVEHKARAKVVKSQADVIVSDNEKYIERSELRQRAIKNGDNAVASGELVSQDGISASSGYEKGNPVIIINESNYDLDIEIADSHGRVFKFRLDRGEVKGGGDEPFKLEVGNNRVRSFRSKESNKRPFTETMMGVKSVPYFYYNEDKDNQDKSYCGFTIIRGGNGW